jgi:hypothetical protein
LRCILLLASLFLLLAPPVHAALVNGSFEPADGAPAPGAGLAAAIPGWRITGPGVTWLALSGAQAAAPNGDHVLRLAGVARTPARIEQSFATVPGQSYDIAFWLGSRADARGRGRAAVRVELDGTARTVAIDNPSPELLWQAHVLTFTATGTRTTLAFRGARGAAWLDGVAVQPAATAAATPRKSR